MSSPSTPRLDGSGQQSKQMSSRLATMKFMQRSSATNRNASQPVTPNSEPAPKRRRVEESPNYSSPVAAKTEPRSYISRFGVGAAFKIRPVLEDIISQERVAVDNTSETEWVLNIPFPSPEPSSQEEEGDAAIENEHNDDWTAETNGRQSYGSFKKKKKTTNEQDTKTNAPNRYGVDLSDDMNEEDSRSDEGSSDEVNNDAVASKGLRRGNHIAPAMDYTDEQALAALDTVDLSRSSYAKSKGAFVPCGRAGSGGRFGGHHQGQASAGKFRNNDKVHKKTKHKKK